jgi:hypothetical protein
MARVSEGGGSGKGKGRPKPTRSCSLWHAGDGRAVLTITEHHIKGDVPAHYFLKAVPCEIGGLGYEVQHLEVDGGECYSGHIDGERSSCSCPGGVFNGRCKHIDALRSLLAAGKLPPAPAMPEPAPAPAREGWDNL